MAAPGYNRLRETWESLPAGQWSAARQEGEILHAVSFDELLGVLQAAALTLNDVTFAYKPGEEEILA